MKAVTSTGPGGACRWCGGRSGLRGRGPPRRAGRRSPTVTSSSPAATAPSSSPIIGATSSRRISRWTSQKPITDFEPRSRAAVETSRCSREAMPKTTMRPSGARTPSSASKASPPLMWRTASTRSPPLASRIASPRSSARESTVASAPSRSTSARFSSLEARPITFAPARLPSCTASDAGAAGGGLDDQRLAGLDPGAALHQRHRGQALQQQRRRLVVVDLVGHRNQQRLGHGDLLRVAAAAAAAPRRGARPAVRPLTSAPGISGSDCSAR